MDYLLYDKNKDYESPAAPAPRGSVHGLWLATAVSTDTDGTKKKKKKKITLRVSAATLRLSPATVDAPSRSVVVPGCRPAQGPGATD